MKADKVWLIVHNDPAELRKSFSNSIGEHLSQAGIEHEFETADRTQLFDTLRALRSVILSKE